MPETLERTAESAAPEARVAQKMQRAAKRQQVRGHLPDKRTINLAAVNVKRINWRVAVPSILLVLLAIAAVAKFAVLDRINDISVARREVLDLQERLDKSYAALESYDEINEVYAHYTYSGMTDEECGRADRIAMMEMIRRVSLPGTPIERWTVRGNQLVLSISADTLQEINLVVQRLLEEDIVDYCTVSTAGTADIRGYGYSSTPAPEGATVSADVVVQLKSAQQEG